MFFHFCKRKTAGEAASQPEKRQRLTASLFWCFSYVIHIRIFSVANPKRGVNSSD
jgi:hypothetical protein